MRLQGLTDAAGLEQVFLSGYGALPRAGGQDRVAVYTRASLLRLACLYSLRPGWHHLAGRLLGEVAR